MAKPIDGNMMGYKREAATYYVQSVAQSTFTVTSAINAVKDVSDPASLATSKAVTDSLKRGVANASNIASQPAAEAERSEEGTSTQGAPTAIPSLPFYGSSLLGCLLAYIGLWNLKRASRFKASQLAASI